MALYLNKGENPTRESNNYTYLYPQLGSTQIYKSSNNKLAQLPSNPFLHPTCVQAVLSHVHNWVSKVQILGILMDGPLLILLGRVCWPLQGKQSQDCAVVQSRWQGCTQACCPHLESLFLCQGQVQHVHTTLTSCDPGHL